MRTLVWSGQEGMAFAVSRLNGSLRGPSQQFDRRHLTSTSTWQSIWHRVSGFPCKERGLNLFKFALGATSLRAMGSASSHGPGAASTNAAGPRVCILGGGFGGLYTAVKLEGLMWPRGTKPHVTLVDQADRFTFKPLLYELITETATIDEVAPSYSQLLSPYPVTIVRGRVAAVKPDAVGPDSSSEGGGTVVLSSGEALPYDWLVLALGAETLTYGVPGVKEYAVPFSTYEDAVKVDSKLRILNAAPAFPEIVIVGGGYAGVELAAAISDRLGGRGLIQLVTSTSDILQGSPDGQREAARRALQDSGVSVMPHAAVSEIRLAASPDSESAKRIVYVKDSNTGKSEILEADLVVWTAGQAPVSRADGVDVDITTSAASDPNRGSKLSLPFPLDPRGAMQTEPTLRVLRNSHVFALGDVAVSSGQSAAAMDRLPATAQVALQQADYVAWNIWASLNNRPLLKFSYQHLGDMMSLGSAKGAVSLPIPVPPPLSAAAQAGPLSEILRVAGVKLSTTYSGASDGVTVEGPLAAALRRAAYLYRQPTDQQRLRVAASWAGQASKQAAEVARQILGGRSSGGRARGDASSPGE